MTKVKGVIGVSGGELARYAITYHSIFTLQMPPGAVSVPARGANIAENRNGIAKHALRLGAEWVFYMDDDQVFAPDTLTRLLADKKDVVSGLYLSRAAPFIPHVYDAEDERGWLKPRLLLKGDHGLHKVLSTAAGCLLVKTKVLKAMSKKGLAGHDGEKWWNLGQMKDCEDGWGDDHHFCKRVREAGFEIWNDFEVVVGHQMNGTLWPNREADGSWYTLLIQAQAPEPIAKWPAAMLRKDVQK